MFKFFTYLNILVFLALPLQGQEYFSYFAEAKYSKNFKHFAYANPKSPKKGEIRFAQIGSFDSLNPFILSGTSAAGLEYLYDSLLTRSYDEISSYYGLLAEDIKLTDDAVIFSLRKEAKWHDGTDITSSDVFFSFNILKEKGHPIYRIQLKNILSAEIISKYKIKFYLPKQGQKDLVITLGQIPIISEKYYSNNDFTKTSLDPFLGSGPYKVKEVKAGSHISYEKHHNYWAKNLPVNVGRYNFLEIKYKYYRDVSVAIQALKAGEYDIRNENIAKNWAKQYNIEEVQNGDMIKQKLKHQIPTGMQAFVLNQRLEKFQNKNFRIALTLAFDFEWANKNLFYSSYRRTDSFFSNSIFKAPEQISQPELNLIKSLNLELDLNELNSFSLPQTLGDGNNRINLLKARDLLSAAGYYLNGMQLHDPKTKQPVTIEFLIRSPSFKRIILPYIKNLKKLGIKAKIKMVDHSIYQKSLENFDFEITTKIYGGRMIPGNELFSEFHSETADKIGSQNLAGIKNDNVDIIISEIIKTSNLNDLKNLTALLDRLLLSNYYVIPQWNLGSFRLIYWNKFAHSKYIPPYGLAIDFWWQK